ncbi:MAG: undecaprenyl-diphosphate phosphatase [Clostridia bacterium]|nr:undecaprenyl-diphosphate phosphatase [Clostridia bacterium]
MVEVIKHIILGMVQGLSEFLPISSSGHVKLAQHIFGYTGEENLFVSIMLHVGTLVAVFIVYHKLIFEILGEFFKSIGDIFTGKFSFKNMNPVRRMMVMLIIATALLGVMIIPLGDASLKDYIELINGYEGLLPLGFAFLITGAVLILTFYINKRQRNLRDNANVKDAIIIGGAQCVATIAGISRSGSTMAAGLLCGLTREYMVKFSFILSIPAILAAALSDTAEVLSGSTNISVDIVPLLCGIVSAIVFGVLAIKMIQWLIRKDRYSLFGYYCLALGLFVIVYSII